MPSAVTAVYAQLQSSLNQIRILHQKKKVQAQYPQYWMEAEFAKLTVCQACMVLLGSGQHNATFCWVWVKMQGGISIKYNRNWDFCGNEWGGYCCRPESKNSYQAMDAEQSKVHGLENMNRRKYFMLTAGHVLDGSMWTGKALLFQFRTAATTIQFCLTP